MIAREDQNASEVRRGVAERGLDGRRRTRQVRSAPIRSPAPADRNPGQSLSILDPLAFSTYQPAPNCLDPCPFVVPAPVSAAK